MKKQTKGVITVASLGLCAMVLTGCTKSFCSVQDKAELISIYEKNNIKTINEKAAKNGMLLPSDEFIAFIDDKVEEYVASEDCPKDDKGVALRSFAKFAGYNEKGKATLYYNYDKWYQEACVELGVSKCPGVSYISFYKSSLNSGISGKTACLTPEEGDFGLGENQIFVEGKSWGQAFVDYGPIEGLLVYPIGAMIHYFTKAFGMYTGQVAAIILMTVIIRTILFLVSFPATRSQNKMSELQPQINALQQKYPNAQTNSYDKQKLAQEQMELFKKNHVHPFLQMLFMIPQMIVFICVVSALQGAAVLSQGTIFSTSFTSITYKAILGWNHETPFALILFLLMAVAQAISTLLPQMFQKWKEKKFNVNLVKVQENKQKNSMKYISYFMLVFIVLISLSLPISMAIYWFIGALINIIQTLIMEAINTSRRHKNNKNGGNSGASWQRNKNKKKKKSSDKFSIRRG